MTWPDLDVAPQLRPVGGAGGDGDRFGGIGADGADEAADAEEDGEQSEQRAAEQGLPMSTAAAICD